jgi:hypothetical protein
MSGRAGRPDQLDGIHELLAARTLPATDCACESVGLRAEGEVGACRTAAAGARLGQGAVCDGRYAEGQPGAAFRYSRSTRGNPTLLELLARDKSETSWRQKFDERWVRSREPDSNQTLAGYEGARHSPVGRGVASRCPPPSEGPKCRRIDAGAWPRARREQHFATPVQLAGARYARHRQNPDSDRSLALRSIGTVFWALFTQAA